MKNKILLVLIILIASFFRLYKLGSIPNSYTPDEVAQAYTAYSILKTGQDEWGNSFILNLRSFGDFKPPIQTFLMIPSIKIFGLTPFALRLPNAIFSIFTVLLVYLLANKLFKNKSIGLISSLFFALSPWSLPMSRIALEANLVVFIVSLATYLFVLFLENKKLIFLILSSFFFGISLFTYHSAKLFIPLFLIILIIYSKIYTKKLFLIVFSAIFLFLFLFNYQVNNQIKTSRTGDIAIFNPTDKWQGVSDTQYEITKNGMPYPITKIFYNKIVYLSETFTANYFSYFSPQFLLTTGAGETTYGMLPGYGVLGFIPFIGFISAIFFLIRNKFDKYKKEGILLFVSISIAPLAASIAKGNYSANRVSLMMPFIQIISALGIFLLFQNISFSKNLFKKFLSLLIFLIFSLTSIIFLQRYFFQGNQILANGMLFGHKEVNEYLKNYPDVEKIIYSKKLSEPQAFVSFFNEIDPKITQKESVNWLQYEKEKRSFLDQLNEYHLQKYTFKEIQFSSDSQTPNTIIVGRPEEFGDVKPDKTIYYPSYSKQESAIYIYHTKTF